MCGTGPNTFEGSLQQAEHSCPGAVPKTMQTAFAAQTSSHRTSGMQTQTSLAVCPPDCVQICFDTILPAGTPFPFAKAVAGHVSPDMPNLGEVHKEQFIFPSAPCTAPKMPDVTALQLSTPSEVQKEEKPLPESESPVCRSPTVNHSLQDWNYPSYDVNPQPNTCMIEFEKSAAVASDGEDEISSPPAPSGSDSKPARILPPGITTIVVRNIPARFSQEKLLEVWPPDGSFNLLYLPYSFQRRRRSGIGFINMVSHEAAVEFTARWHGQKLADIGGAKRLDVGVADVQGFAGNLKHLKTSNIGRISNEYFLPVAFKGTKKLDFKALLTQKDFEEIDDERLESLVVA